MAAEVLLRTTDGGVPKDKGPVEVLAPVLIQLIGALMRPVRQRFSAADGNLSAGQTVLTVPDGYAPGLVTVFKNGQLAPDATATTGTTVVFASPLEANDVVDVRGLRSGLIGDVASAVHTHGIGDVLGLVTALADKAPTASPTFTGTATMPSLAITSPGSVGDISGMSAKLPALAQLSPATRALGEKLIEMGPSALDSLLTVGDGSHDDWAGIQGMLDQARSGLIPPVVRLPPRNYPKYYKVSRPLIVPPQVTLVGSSGVIPYDSAPWVFPNQITPCDIRTTSDFVGESVIYYETGATIEGVCVSGPQTCVINGVTTPVSCVAPLVRQSVAKGKFAKDAILKRSQYSDPDALPYAGGFAHLKDVVTIGGTWGFNETFAQGTRYWISTFYALDAGLFCNAGMNDCFVHFLWAVGSTGSPANNQGRGAYIAGSGGVREFVYCAEECQGDGIHLYKCWGFDLAGKNSHNGGYGIRFVDCYDATYSGMFVGNGHVYSGAASAHISIEGDDSRAKDPGTQRIVDNGSNYVVQIDPLHGLKPEYIFRSTSTKSTLRTISHLPKQVAGVFADQVTRKSVQAFALLDDAEKEFRGSSLIRKKFMLVKGGTATVDIPLSLPVAEYVDDDPLEVIVTHQTYVGVPQANQMGRYLVWIGNENGPKAQAILTAQAGGDFAYGFDPATGVTASMPDAQTVRIAIMGGASVGDQGNPRAILVARRLTGTAVTGGDVTGLAI